MIAQNNYNNQRGPSVGGYAHNSQPQPDNGPRPEAKETGERPWVLLHSYRVGDTYSDITSAMNVPGGVIIRSATKTAKGLSQSMVFVPGPSLADFAPNRPRRTQGGSK